MTVGTIIVPLPSVLWNPFETGRTLMTESFDTWTMVAINGWFDEITAPPFQVDDKLLTVDIAIDELALTGMVTALPLELTSG
jgi:hypothetical protein